MIIFPWVAHDLAYRGVLKSLYFLRFFIYVCSDQGKNTSLHNNPFFAPDACIRASGDLRVVDQSKNTALHNNPIFAQNARIQASGDACIQASEAKKNVVMRWNVTLIDHLKVPRCLYIRIWSALEA